MPPQGLCETRALSNSSVGDSLGWVLLSRGVAQCLNLVFPLGSLRSFKLPFLDEFLTVSLIYSPAMIASFPRACGHTRIAVLLPSSPP
ncbi:hypothetical protein SCLCIDRAFT_1048906 [Scleroderma citrinum Foug A]|uniref:Uncharacterized protein n=1 Tax=Scleroderma citrinum Foug A TaxID=1036808 RepID=A0A0C3DRN6_9AGAM|nr:hypothetical protein SCLCIDRAFT_1048906 [Scleroderma citrinum Foug A]